MEAWLLEEHSLDLARGLFDVSKSARRVWSLVKPQGTVEWSIYGTMSANWEAKSLMRSLLALDHSIKGLVGYKSIHVAEALLAKEVLANSMPGSCIYHSCNATVPALDQLTNGAEAAMSISAPHKISESPDLPGTRDVSP